MEIKKRQTELNPHCFIIICDNIEELQKNMKTINRRFISYTTKMLEYNESFMNDDIATDSNVFL